MCVKGTILTDCAIRVTLIVKIYQHSGFKLLFCIYCFQKVEILIMKDTVWR